jgi:FeS assembly protein IscX
MGGRDTFGWLETDLIGEALAEVYPERDPVRVGFVELKQLVQGLPGFKEEPGHPVNEKILEHIQAAWIEEREDRREEEEE